MGLTLIKINDVKNVLKASLRHKFLNYNPEPAAMPFHSRLLGQDRLALFSFIHSLNTNFGTSIFEPVSKEIAAFKFASAESQQVAGSEISAGAFLAIEHIMNELTTGRKLPNQPEETEILKNVCREGEMKQVKLTKVDVKLIDNEGTIHLFDIKTAKPNAGGFKEFKRTLLQWTAATLAKNPVATVKSLICIPYNPYAPQPYARWTMRGMLDLENELKVGEEFWDFLSGDGTYQNLLKIFEEVGIELRDEIDEYFKKYKIRD